MSSSKSEVDSEPEVKKDKLSKDNKETKELTMEDLEKNVNVLLEETSTIFTLFVPSTAYKL